MLNKDTDFEAGVILPIDKPYGWTSADVVRRVKAALRHIGYKKIKIGHAGTLDPLATGVLIICMGKATKQVEAIQAQPKEYVCEVELGATTPCFDMEHPVDHRYPYDHITRRQVEEALISFIGEQEQLPPVFSAKLIDGRRAYEYARAGEEVEMRRSLITIYEAELLNFDLPKVEVRIVCSKGTYIRSFARDLGVTLSSGGHLTALRRTRNGDYMADDCYKIEEVTEALR